MRYWLFLLVGVFLVLPVLAQVDATATPDGILLTPTETPTATLTPTSTLTSTSLPSSTPELTEIIQPTSEVSAEITLEVTETLEVTAEVSPESVLIEPVSSPSPTLVSPEIQPEITVEVTAEATASVEITPEVTEAFISLTGNSLATATPGGIPLHFVQGIATYQNRASSAGIEVMVWSEDNTLLSVATTNDNGIYSVPVPIDQAYLLNINGELHRVEQVQVELNQPVPPITLAGGDLDDDGCIGQADLDMLIRNYDIAQTSTTDINADSITNLSDLAILTGNYQDCANEQSVIEITPEVIAEATAEATPEMTIEGTTEITPEVTEVSTQP